MKNIFTITAFQLFFLQMVFAQIGYTKKYAGVWYDADAIAFINVELNIGIEHASASIDWELHFKDGEKDNFASNHSSYHYAENGTGYFSRDDKTGSLSVPIRHKSGYRVNQFKLWDFTFFLSEDEKLLTGNFQNGSVRCTEVKQKVKLKKGWSGEMKDGKKSGFGYYLFTRVNETTPRQSEQFIFIGQYQADTLQGQGIVITNGLEKITVYHGNFKNHQFQGPGQKYIGGCPAYDDDVLYYTGNFVNSKFEGKVFGFNCDNKLVSECNAINGNLNCKLLIVDHRTKQLAELFALGTLGFVGGKYLLKESGIGSGGGQSGEGYSSGSDYNGSGSTKKTETKKAVDCFTNATDTKTTHPYCNKYFTVYKLKCGNGDEKRYFHVQKEIDCGALGLGGSKGYYIPGSISNSYLGSDFEKAMKKLCDCE